MLLAEVNTVEVVKKLLNRGPAAINHYIRWAALNGRCDIVKLLLKDSRTDPGSGNNYAIRWAASHHHYEVVKVLLDDPRVDPCDWDHYMIKHHGSHTQTYIMVINHIKYRFNILDYIKFASELGPGCKKMWRGVIIKYRWHVRALLEEYLSVDLMPQLIHYMTNC